MSFPNSRVHIFKNVSISFHNLSAMIAPPKKIKNISFAFFNNQSTFSFPHLHKVFFFNLFAQIRKQSPNFSSIQTKFYFLSFLSLSLPAYSLSYYIIFYLNIHNWHVEEIRSAVL